MGNSRCRSATISASTRRCASVRWNGSTRRALSRISSVIEHAGARCRRRRPRSRSSTTARASSSSNARRRCAGVRRRARSSNRSPSATSLAGGRGKCAHRRASPSGGRASSAGRTAASGSSTSPRSSRARATSVRTRRPPHLPSFPYIGTIRPRWIGSPSSSSTSHSGATSCSPHPLRAILTAPCSQTRAPAGSVFARYGWLNQTTGSEPVPSSMTASTMRIRRFRAPRSTSWTSRPLTVTVASGVVSEPIRTGLERSSYRCGRRQSRSPTVARPSASNIRSPAAPTPLTADSGLSSASVIRRRRPRGAASPPGPAARRRRWRAGTA